MSASGDLPRRLGVNLLYLVPGEVGGSEVVARKLLGALRRTAPQMEIVVYAGPEAVESLVAEPWGGEVEIVRSPVRSRSKPLRLAAELAWLPVRARRDGVGLLHSLGTTAPIFTSGPSVVTVLDLIYEHFPETFPKASRAGLRLLVPAGARRADRVIAISEAGKRDIAQTLGIDAGKIDVVHLGFGQSDTGESAPEQELRERYGLGAGPLLLTVSAALRHKNLPRLLKAFASLDEDPSPNLVVIGHAGLELEPLRELARTLGVEGRVVFTGWIDQRDVEGFYDAAIAFAYPSLMEGFGMPVLEAMAHGVPVACSNTSSLPEVAGDAAEFFDPESETAIADALRRLLADEGRREQLVALGHQRYPQFTWEASAEATLEVYRRAGARSSRRTQRQ